MFMCRDGGLDREGVVQLWSHVPQALRTRLRQLGRQGALTGEAFSPFSLFALCFSLFIFISFLSPFVLLFYFLPLYSFLFVVPVIDLTHAFFFGITDFQPVSRLHLPDLFTVPNRVRVQ